MWWGAGRIGGRENSGRDVLCERKSAFFLSFFCEGVGFRIIIGW